MAVQEVYKTAVRLEKRDDDYGLDAIDYSENLAETYSDLLEPVL